MVAQEKVRRQKRPARAGSRGAVMVEAVAALPFFILIFAGTIFIGQLYRAKLTTMREARNAAWQHAVEACVGDGAKKQMGGKPAGTGADLNFGYAQDYSGTTIASEEFGSVVADADPEEVTASGVLGGYTVTVTSRMVLACNEERRDGTVDEAIEYVWGLLEGGLDDDVAASTAKVNAEEEAKKNTKKKGGPK